MTTEVKTNPAQIDLSIETAQPALVFKGEEPICQYYHKGLKTIVNSMCAQESFMQMLNKDDIIFKCEEVVINVMGALIRIPADIPHLGINRYRVVTAILLHMRSTGVTAYEKMFLTGISSDMKPIFYETRTVNIDGTVTAAPVEVHISKMQYTQAVNSALSPFAIQSSLVVSRPSDLKRKPEESKAKQPPKKAAKPVCSRCGRNECGMTMGANAVLGYLQSNFERGNQVWLNEAGKNCPAFKEAVKKHLQFTNVLTCMLIDR